MDIQALRWFKAVAEGITVTDTAAEAHITQPALSRSLARLEQETGTALFARSGRTLRLTPAGHAFKRHADEVLDRYDQGLRAVAEIVDPESGLVPLAFLPTLGTWLVPYLVRSFRELFPRIRFALSQDDEAALADALLNGTADLILTSEDPGHALIGWRRLLVEPLRIVVPPGHRLARRQRARLTEVADETFVALRPGFGLRTATDRLCRQAGFAPRIGFEGSDVETLRGLVTAGLGVSLLPPPRTATFPPSCAPHPAPQLTVTDVPCNRDIGLAWLTERPLPAASEGFRHHAREVVPRLLREE